MRKSGGQGLFLITLMTSLASAYYEGQGKYGEAESTLLEAVRIERANGEDAPGTMSAIRALASAYFRHGKYADGEPLFGDLVAVERRAAGEANSQTRIDMYALGDVYLTDGKFALAEGQK